MVWDFETRGVAHTLDAHMYVCSALPYPWHDTMPCMHAHDALLPYAVEPAGQCVSCPLARPRAPMQLKWLRPCSPAPAGRP